MPNHWCVLTTPSLQFDEMKKLALTAVQQAGAVAFGGLGAYTYYSGHENLRLQQNKILKSGTRFSMQSRHTAVTGTAALFLGMGIWRLVN